VVGAARDLELGDGGIGWPDHRAAIYNLGPGVQDDRAAVALEQDELVISGVAPGIEPPWFLQQKLAKSGRGLSCPAFELGSKTTGPRLVEMAHYPFGSSSFWFPGPAHRWPGRG
jgi:hypothetical protein